MSRFRALAPLPPASRFALPPLSPRRRGKPCAPIGNWAGGKGALSAALALLGSAQTAPLRARPVSFSRPPLVVGSPLGGWLGCGLAGLGKWPNSHHWHNQPHNQPSTGAPIGGEWAWVFPLRSAAGRGARGSASLRPPSPALLFRGLRPASRRAFRSARALRAVRARCGVGWGWRRGLSSKTARTLSALFCLLPAFAYSPRGVFMRLPCRRLAGRTPCARLSLRIFRALSRAVRAMAARALAPSARPEGGGLTVPGYFCGDLPLCASEQQSRHCAPSPLAFIAQDLQVRSSAPQGYAFLLALRHESSPIIPDVRIVFPCPIIAHSTISPPRFAYTRAGSDSRLRPSHTTSPRSS